MKMFITASALVSWCGLKPRNEYTPTVVRKKNAIKVKVAIARKMLIAIWHVLSEGKPYTDYKKPDTKGNLQYTAYGEENENCKKNRPPIKGGLYRTAIPILSPSFH